MRYFTSCLWLTLAVAATVASAAEPRSVAQVAAEVAPFLDAEALVVAHLDLTQVDPRELGNWIDALGSDFISDGQRPRIAAGVLAALAAGGVERVEVVLSLADYDHGGVLPFVLLFPADASIAKSGLEKLVAPATIERIRDTLVLAKSSTLARLRALEPVARPELTVALDAVGPGAVQIALIPTADQQRVLREFSFPLPVGLGGGVLSGVTYDLRWLAASYQTQTPGLRATLDFATPAAADAARAAIAARLQKLATEADAGEVAPLQALASALQPELADNRLVLAISEADRLPALRSALETSLGSARRRIGVSESMRKLKTLGIAMVNEADSAAKGGKSRYLDAAIRNPAGQPLMSWRVHLLQYLDGGKELYRQFHLDEPWDSPHNLALVPRMPAIYASGDLDPVDGKTRFLLPVGAETLFPEGHGLLMEDVKDGLSNTIAAVEVEPGEAVIWTKPDDLQFDPAHPRTRLAKDFSALLADGSGHRIDAAMDDARLRALFTANGKEEHKP